MSHVSSQWFHKQLLSWYAQDGRHALPWKSPVDPYRIWVSEVMLQQTQVATVIPYFEKFMKSFPDVNALSQASPDKLFHHWAGLGYYSRARNLYKTAKIIAEKYKGHFPKEVALLEELPGIGRSTAGAIVAQAFNIWAPILDGNVKRVLARFHRIPGWTGQSSVTQQLWTLAEYYTPPHQVADYTQAIMDLGATCCTRTRPHCLECPLKKHCLAFEHDEQHVYPEKKPPKKIPTQALWMLVVLNQKGELLLQQRPQQGIWSGLWSLPEFTDMALAKRFSTHILGVKRQSFQTWEPIKHTFSHYHLMIQPQFLQLKDKPAVNKKDKSLAWVNQAGLIDRGLPAPIQKIVKKVLF